MTPSAIRSLPARTGCIPKNVSSLTQIAYGRAPQYRRITTYSGWSSSSNSRHLPTAATISPVLLRSRLLPSPINLQSLTSVRYVSFKEMREARAREKAGETPSQPAPNATKKSPEQAPKPDPVESSAKSSTYDAAEEAFSRIRAETGRQRQKIEDEEEPEQKTGDDSAESKDDKKSREEKKEAPPPPHGSKTPWQVFTETLQSEFKASKEWNESTKELGGTIHNFTQNPNVQRARSAYSKAAEAATSTTGKVVFGTAGAIGKGAAWTWDTSLVRGLRAGASAVGSGVEKATRPVRQTEAYKNVKDVIDDGSSQRYGGWTEKEERKRKREERDAKMGYKAPETHDEDPNAGTNVTLHKDSAWKESWKNFRENSPVMQRFFNMSSTYRESENPIISVARGVSDRIAGFFAENETAMVIRKFREMDPSFQLEPFLTEMRTYILPEVLEAYVKGDVEVLKVWLSAAQFQVYHALMQQYTTAGLKSDGKILDIRNVEIMNARMLDPGEIPVFVLMCRTQEVHVYRNAKSGELAAGMEDKVQQVTYAIGVTRIPEEVSNPETRGWRFIEMQKSARDYV